MPSTSKLEMTLPTQHALNLHAASWLSGSAATSTAILTATVAACCLLNPPLTGVVIAFTAKPVVLLIGSIAITALLGLLALSLYKQSRLKDENDLLQFLYGGAAKNALNNGAALSSAELILTTVKRSPEKATEDAQFLQEHTRKKEALHRLPCSVNGATYHSYSLPSLKTLEQLKERSDTECVDVFRNIISIQHDLVVDLTDYSQQDVSWTKYLKDEERVADDPNRYKIGKKTTVLQLPTMHDMVAHASEVAQALEAKKSVMIHCESTLEKTASFLCIVELLRKKMQFNNNDEARSYLFYTLVQLAQSQKDRIPTLEHIATYYSDEFLNQLKQVAAQTEIERQNKN